MPPAHTHLARRVRNVRAAETARQIFHQAAPVIVVKPILQIMQPREIFAAAFAAAIPVELDVMQ